MFDATVREGVLQVARPGTRWLSSGWAGGFETAAAAYNLSVPDGWRRTDLDTYVGDRRSAAGFESAGPHLLTGVDLEHLRAARYGPVEVYATAGISNPAALPMETGETATDKADRTMTDGETHAGTVNIIVGTTRALDDGAMANLLAVAAEAKAATLLATTGFPGTTTDAVVVGSDPEGEPSRFSGSATAVGAATRACVRDAVRASLDSRYDSDELPGSVANAADGVETTRSATVFVP